jgi:hypothetical protein
MYLFFFTPELSWENNSSLNVSITAYVIKESQLFSKLWVGFLWLALDTLWKSRRGYVSFIFVF